MKATSLNIVIAGLSITSSWGNGHATTFRALIKELNVMGHHVDFLERDVPWYASQRDMPNPEFCSVHLYKDLNELQQQYLEMIKHADLVIVGSYVPEGVAVGEWVCQQAQGVKAFYDIDTPVTLAKLERKDYDYLSADLIAKYDMYLSFSGGPILDLLEQKYGSPCAKALYCSVDPDLYFPEKVDNEWDLGYLGTYSADRQPPLEKLLFDAAKRWPEGKFVVAGPQYPDDVKWQPNITHIHHLPPERHRKFYNSQKFTLNITRADMIKAGYSPSVRLFEAAACGTPIISDYWEGLETIFQLDKEVFISRGDEDTLSFLRDMAEPDRLKAGELAKGKIMKYHTARHRATELLNYTYALTRKNLMNAD